MANQKLSAWRVVRGGPGSGGGLRTRVSDADSRAHGPTPHRRHRGAAGRHHTPHSHRRGRFAPLAGALGGAAGGARQERQRDRQPDPDQMGTAILLRGGGREEIVPDPLRHELRTLAALVGAGGGRFVLVPAGLVFRRTGGPADGRTGGAAEGRTGGVGAQHAAPLPHGLATAELTVVMVDVRTGRVGFRTVARGEGNDPWTALTGAVKSLTLRRRPGVRLLTATVSAVKGSFP